MAKEPNFLSFQTTSSPVNPPPHTKNIINDLQPIWLTLGDWGGLQLKKKLFSVFTVFEIKGNTANVGIPPETDATDIYSLMLLLFLFLTKCLCHIILGDI